MNQNKIVSVVVMASVIAGCASPVTEKALIAYNDNSLLIKNQQATQQDSMINYENRGSANKINGIWLGAKSIPLKGDPVLPEAFRVIKEFHFPGQTFTLSQAADRIYAVSHIQVRVAPDVNITAANNASNTAASGATPIPTPLPGIASNVASTKAAPPIMVSLDATATTAGILDQITAANGLSWEYRDGVATIQRLVTRTFTLKATPGTSTYNYQSGKTGTSTAAAGTPGSTAGTISTGFTSTSLLNTTEKMDPMSSVEAAIKSVLTPVGKVVTSPTTGSIMVIDAVEGVERAARVVDRENDILTRNAVFKVDVLSFTANDQDEAGMNLQGIFNNLSKFGATVTSPTTLTGSGAASIGMQVLTGKTPGKYDGTQAIINLLSQKGNVSIKHTMDVRTRNLNVTPVSILDQTVYLASTTPASASATGTTGGVPGLQPGTITTGFTMSLQPNIMDSNQIALQFSVGMVDLLGITTLSSGTGVNQQSIQAPATSGFEFKQDVFLKPYETVILTGYDYTENDYSRNGLTADTPLVAGGSYTATRKKNRVFILITPTIVGNSF